MALKRWSLLSRTLLERTAFSGVTGAEGEFILGGFFVIVVPEIQEDSWFETLSCYCAFSHNGGEDLMGRVEGRVKLG